MGSDPEDDEKLLSGLGGLLGVALVFMLKPITSTSAFVRRPNGPADAPITLLVPMGLVPRYFPRALEFSGVATVVRLALAPCPA